jgi:uncharacterized SAM-binding protein YcdF (DUF218 family)
LISLAFIGFSLGLFLHAFNVRISDRKRAYRSSAAALALGLTGVLFLPGGYLIQKIVGRLLMPMGMLWAALFFASIWFFVHKNRRGALMSALVWTSVTLAGSPFIGGWLISSLEQPFAKIDVYQEAPFDAILVLGGGVSGGGNYAQLSESGDRPIVAARMYNRGLSKLLVTSGSSIPGINTQIDVAATTSIIWRDLGIPDSAIVRVPDPKNTSEEIKAFAQMAGPEGWKRIGLINSAFHMRRALKLAETNGLVVTPLPTDFKGSRHYEGILSWIPDANGFMKTQKACWEYLGAAVGR